MQNLRVFVLRFRPGLSWFGLGVGLSWLLIAPCVRSDDWPGPIVREVFSKNRDYFVRITPGESVGQTYGFASAKVGKHATAAFFQRQVDRGYKLEREIEIANPVAPVEFFVSNAGELVTLDNWHNVGYGVILALYRNDGRMVKAYRLGDLFAKSELDSFSHSVSSIWWHKGPTYIDEDQKVFYMGYREAPDYRELILRLGDGVVRICGGGLKYACRGLVARSDFLWRW
jgi:hypothetical protein